MHTVQKGLSVTGWWNVNWNSEPAFLTTVMNGPECLEVLAEELHHSQDVVHLILIYCDMLFNLSLLKTQ